MFVCAREKNRDKVKNYIGTIKSYTAYMMELIRRKRSPQSSSMGSKSIRTPACACRCVSAVDDLPGGRVREEVEIQGHVESL